MGKSCQPLTNRSLCAHAGSNMIVSKLLYGWFESAQLRNMEEKKFKYGTKEYWKDWYWNKGGREKVQAKRYIREYERDRQKRRACNSGVE